MRSPYSLRNKCSLFSTRTLYLCIVFVCCVFCTRAFACVETPGTELEKIYCQIKAKGKGQNLPDFQAFRRNPPSTQALLLKQPARKLGIDLPDTSSTARSALASTPVIESQQIVPVSEEVSVKTPAEDKTSILNRNIQSNSASRQLQQQCKLNNDLILCGSSQYELQTNLTNRHLSSQTFSSDNKLLLPSRQGSAFASASDHYYLSQTYIFYIEKMVDLGLADATMSFTKYAATYDDITRRGGNFEQRFAQMYELLKKEKQTNAVKSRYNNLFPQSLEQCMELSQKIIVCDNIKQNWIYQAK